MAKTKYGIQSSVMAFEDPFHDNVKKLKRTGEGMYFKPQDKRPSVKDYIALLKNFNIDFYFF